MNDTMKPVRILNYKRRNAIKENLTGYAFIFPQMLAFLVFMVYPIFEGIRLSFYDLDFVSNRFIGLDNYRALMQDKIFFSALTNTIIYMFFVTLFTVVFGFIISSAIFDKSERYMAFIRGSLYLPVILSMVVMSIVWSWILNNAVGLVPYIMETILGIKRVNFLSDERFVIPTVIFMIWMFQIGQAVILYVAAMLSIDPSILESAKIDGASRGVILRRILIPLVRPVTLYIIVSTLINVMRAFAVIHLMTGGGPNYKTINMMYLCYEYSFKFGRIGYGAAVGVVMFLVVFIASITRFKALSENI
ncbi:MAG TPA: sugar ABC transporter permease [Clostridiaceae bacterium]|nr:sugar ABC transporter permease [Clostridiaceae bacterium]